MSRAESVDMLIMERTSVVRALKPLQASGWVVAERNDNDRTFDVTLSPLGLEKLAQAMPLCAERHGVLSKVKPDVLAPSGSATKSWNLTWERDSVFAQTCVTTQFPDHPAVHRVVPEITLAFTQPQPSTQEMNDEHADVLGNRRDR